MAIAKLFGEKCSVISDKQNMLHNDNHNVTSQQKQSPIAEVEILPHDHHIMSLGVYNSDNQPQGFTVRLEPQNEHTKHVDAQVSSKKAACGTHYFLQIANNSNATFSAEISQF